MKKTLKNKLLEDPSYSVRRAFVDDFFFAQVKKLPPKAKILDMGGKKINKRGEFNLDKYDFKVQYANIDAQTKPDFLCDIAQVPVANQSFDVVILSEVLEHLAEPELVLQEAYRVLKKNGLLLLVTPFIFHVHADPSDYGRYTHFWYQEKLSKIGFSKITIVKQGLFFAVLANMLKLYTNQVEQKQKGQMIKKQVLKFCSQYLTKKSFEWDQRDFIKNNLVLSNYTTGYGVVGRK